MQMEQDIPASALVRVSLLGPLEVYKRDASGAWKLVSEDKWKNSRPARSVLKRLLVQPGRRLSREQLADDVWSESGSEPTGTTVYSAISLIRGVIGKPLVKLWVSAYEIAGQALVWTDIDGVKALFKEAENLGHASIQAFPLLEQALILLERGELLEGEYGQWCYAFRKRVEDMLREVRLWLAESYEMQGKLWQAGEQYRATVLADPSDEEALQRWLEMLYRHGKRQEALKCYQDMRDFVEAQGLTLSKTLEQAVISRTKQPTLALISPVQPLEDMLYGTENSTEEPGFMDHLRRQINIQGARIALGLASLPALSTDLLEKRLLIALRQRPSPDVETVQYLQQRVEHYWEQRQTARLGQVLVPYVTEDLQRVTTFLEGSLITDIRTEFSIIAGNLAMLLGELFFEQNLYPEARQYYKTAAIAAHEANNPLLEAVIYGRRSLTWIYQNQLNVALSCVQHGRALAAHDDRITIWLTAMEAEIQAKMGNQHDCLISLKNAGRLRDLPEQKPFYWIHFDVSLLAGYEGACFLKLAKPIEAHQALTQALIMLDVTTNRRKPRLLVDLARAYVQQREIEAACASLLEAIDLLHSIKSPLTHKRLLSLRQDLQPWQETTSIQRLDEALYQLTEMR